MIPFALGFPDRYEIVIKGASAPIILNTTSNIEEPYFDRTLDLSGNNLSLSFMEGNTIAFLKVASFNYYRWADFEVFKAFIDSSFSEIRKKDVKTLLLTCGKTGRFPILQYSFIAVPGESTLHLLFKCAV